MASGTHLETNLEISKPQPLRDMHQGQAGAECSEENDEKMR